MGIEIKMSDDAEAALASLPLDMRDDVKRALDRSAENPPDVGQEESESFSRVSLDGTRYYILCSHERIEGALYVEFVDIITY